MERLHTIKIRLKLRTEVIVGENKTSKNSLGFKIWTDTSILW